MIEITEFKPLQKGLLIGFCNVKVPKWGNFFIKGISIFEKNGKKWISFPSKAFEKEGETLYAPHVGFEENAMKEKFQEFVLKALEEYIAKPQAEQLPLFENCPF